MRKLILLLAALMLSACSSSQKNIRLVEQHIDEQRSQQITCADTISRCALPSSLLLQSQANTHRALIIEGGADSLILRLHMIRAARESIDLQYFIFSGDDSGLLLMGELLMAARRGVKVRVLFDQLFSLQDVTYLSQMALAHENLRIRLYNPTFGKASTDKTEFVSGVACCFFRFNQRMHNKIFQIDKKLTIIGGRNISDRYFDMDTNYNFLDRDILFSGPESPEVLESFNSYWTSKVVKPVFHLRDVLKQLLNNELPPLQQRSVPQRFLKLVATALEPEYIEQRFTKQMLQVQKLEYFWDLPRDPASGELKNSRATKLIFKRIEEAEQEVLVQSPYMVLSRHLQKIYQQLKGDHPQIQLRYSTNSLASTDAWTAYALYHKKKKRYVKKLGIEIHELMPFPKNVEDFIPRYKTLIAEKSQGIISSDFMTGAASPTVERPGPRTGLHSKSLIIDNSLAMIGSHNLDPRSEGFNTENGVFIQDQRLVVELKELILKNMEAHNSWVVAARNDFTPVVSDIGGVFEDISRTLPIFDIWPGRYTTAWQIKVDGVQTSPLDPEFYNNYLPVGSFPEVIMTRRQILTLAVGSFFGFLGPIM